MTALDDAIEVLQAWLQQAQDLTATDIGNLWELIGATNLDGWGPAHKQAVIAALREYLPDLVIGNATVVAETTAYWYGALAPAEPYSAIVPPDGPVNQERIATSIGWAVNTATSATTALSQLQGSMQRAVLDAQRETVSYNASREHVRYRRHCSYAACNGCLVLAGRGAIYNSAANAVKGHDNCRCLAVPERPGMTDYTVPPLVRDAEAKYAAAAKELSDEGVASPSLQAIIAKMDALAAAPS